MKHLKLILAAALAALSFGLYAADVTVRVPYTDSTGKPAGFVDTPMRDLGDGTYAPVVTGATGTAGLTQVQGNTASAATDSGNPVKVGGKYNSTLPTFTDGQRADVQLDSRGRVLAGTVNLLTGADGFSNAALAAPPANGDNAGGVRMPVAAPHLFNETSWDRYRNNTSNVELASGARTTTQTGSDHINYNGKGVKVLVNMTVVGTGSVTPSIQIKDANGIYYTVLTGTAIVTNTTQALTIYPGITAAANVSISDILPRTFRIIMTANNANSATYSVGYEIMN